MSAKTKTSVQADVMKQIKQGTVRMRPKTYFILLTSLSIAAVVASAVTIAYIFSICFFWFRVQTADTMAWGARANLAEAMNSFPWWAFVLAVILLVGAALLVKYQGRMHRHKLSNIVLALLAGSLILGAVLSAFGIGTLHTPGAPQQRGPGWQRQLK